MGIGRLVAALSIAAVAAHAAGQSAYPEQPVRILVGFTAGVAPDVTGRLLAEKLSAAWGKAVVVENVTGPAATSLPTASRSRRPTDTRSA